MLKSVMNSVCGAPPLLLDALRNSVAASSVLTTNSVRYRWFKDHPKIIPRNFGYKDKLDFRGPLPRIPTGRPLPMPPYNPTKSWGENKALFGQNDYIDILGDNENIKPIQIQTHIPAWLRGFHGNEYQMLLRKKAFLGWSIRAARPTAYFKLHKRIKFLYHRLNHKTKHFMDRKVLR